MQMNLFKEDDSNEEERIYDRIMCTFEIVCTKCGYDGTCFEEDRMDAADYFKNEGWVVDKHGTVHCSSCVELYKPN